MDVIKNVMLKESVDGEFTTVADVAEATLTNLCWRAKPTSEKADDDNG